MTYSYDANGKPMIPKGTKVRIRTTNGGDTIAVLSHNYYNTYDAQLTDGYTISALRIKSVEPVTE